jgi:DNA repair protein RadC
MAGDPRLGDCPGCIEVGGDRAEGVLKCFRLPERRASKQLLPSAAIERIDTKPLAKRLIERFGTLGDLFAADPAHLRDFDIDQRTLVLFRALRESGRRLALQKVAKKPVLGNWQQLLDYCHTTLAHEKTERFAIRFLNRKNELIADEVQQRGTVDHTPVYPREVVKRALHHEASALILLHNKPSHGPSARLVMDYPDSSVTEPFRWRSPPRRRRRRAYEPFLYGEWSVRIVRIPQWSPLQAKTRSRKSGQPHVVSTEIARVFAAAQR